MEKQKELKQVYAVIKVVDPVLQQPPNQNLPPHVTYQVSGQDPRGEFNMRRRYRQFNALRTKLVQRFVGIYIPPIPSKKAAGNTEERYVQQRRRFLHYFCLKISQKPFLFDSDIFQTFIRGDPDFDRASRIISTHEYALISNIYDLEFRKEAEEADMSKVLIELEKETDILKKVDKQLVNVRQQVQDICDSKSQFIKDYTFVMKQVIPKYERDLVRHHDESGQSQFIQKNELCKAGLEQYLFFCEDNPLEDYVQMMSYDIRQARALLEAIESRKLLQSRKNNFEVVRRDGKEELQKLKAGRTTIKSVFTSGNKQNQMKDLENSISQYERNEAFMAMCLPLSAISIHKDIIEYKTTRALDYLFKIQTIARKQMRLLDYYGNYLTYGLKGSGV